MKRGALQKHATTIVMCVLVAIVGVYVLVIDRGSLTSEETEKRKNHLFGVFRLDDVSEFSVSVAGRAARITRGAMNDAGQRPWEVEIGGKRYPAEEPSVDQFLGVLDYGVVARRIDASAVDRKAFGLETPRLEVTVAMGRHDQRLIVGGPAPSPEGAVYVEVEGRGVAVITKQLAAALDVKPEDFRSKTLLPWGEGDLAAVAIEGESGARKIARGPDEGGKPGVFRVEAAQGGGRVASPALERIWQSLALLKADAWIDDAAADRAFEKRLTLTLTPRDGSQKPLVFEMGGPCPGHAEDVVVIRRSPERASACAPEAVIEGLAIAPEDLVDRRVIGARLDYITEIAVSSEGRKLELARRASEWHLRAPEDRPLDAATGRSIAEGMIGVTADRWLERDADRKALGLDPPRATVRVVSVLPSGGPGGGDDERVETLEVGAVQGDVVHVRRVEDGAIAAVPAAKAAALTPGALALRSLKIINEPAQSFRAIRIENGGRVQRFERGADGAFRLIEPKGAGLAADPGLVNDLAEELGELTASRWVDEGAKAAAFGLEKPRMVIEAELRGDAGAAKEKTVRIAIGAPAPQGSFARAGGDPAIFELPKGLEEAADRWLLDRGALRVDPETIAKVEIAGEGGKSLVVEQQGGVLRVAGAPPDAASAARAAGIRDALADLVAEGAVSVGRPEAHEGVERPRLTVTVTASGAEAGKPVKIAFGAGDSFRGTSVVYARRSGVDATYAVAQAKVRALFDAVGAK